MKSPLVSALAALCLVVASARSFAGESIADYFPLKAGTYWTYDGRTNDGRSAKVTTTAKEGPVMGDNSTIFLDEDETQFFPGLHHYWYFAATASGVQLFRYETPYSGNCKAFTPAVNYLPASAKPGATFVQTHSLDCHAASVLVSRTLRVLHTEKVTVPFGTFDAWRLEEDLTYNVAGGKAVETERHVVWLVDGIGEIKRLWQRRDANGKASFGELKLADTNANRPAATSARNGFPTTRSRLSMGRIAEAWVPD